MPIRHVRNATLLGSFKEAVHGVERQIFFVGRTSSRHSRCYKKGKNHRGTNLLITVRRSLFSLDLLDFVLHR